MINWDAIAAISEAIGVIAIVVSLIYAGYQVRQNTLQLRQENLRETIRSTLDTNWYYHRDAAAFAVFKRGVHDFHALDSKDKAHFHSIVVDLAFYFEVVRNMSLAGLMDKAAFETTQRFIGAILVTPGGRQWLEFAKDTQPMPAAALAQLQSLVENEGPRLRPITELQPWFAADPE